jgi:hypothetical protein
VPRRLLVVATASVPAADLRTSVRAHAGEDAEMLVVAPASGISRLDWLTNAEDDARADAAERADELAEAAPTDDVESLVGDSDPMKAIEDALRTFPADELIVVTLTRGPFVGGSPTLDSPSARLCNVGGLRRRAERPAAWPAPSSSGRAS